MTWVLPMIAALAAGLLPASAGAAADWTVAASAATRPTRIETWGSRSCGWLQQRARDVHQERPFSCGKEGVDCVILAMPLDPAPVGTTQRSTQPQARLSLTCAASASTISFAR